MAKKCVAIALVASCCVAACGGGSGTSPAPVSGSSLSLSGGDGHPILRGTRQFTADQMPFWAGVDYYENHIELRIGEPPSGWTIDLAAPRGQRLVAGTYMDASRYPFNLFGGQPGISVTGERRGCDDIGSFVVTEAQYSPSGAVQRFRATFQQQCERFPDWLRGEIQLLSPPGGQASCP
jgi:hypothetical protein